MGYVGHAKLPENLKALFRPCAMMVPDYTGISEIELYSFGFKNVRPIAVKITAFLNLSSVQLSPKNHNDFRIRTLKAIFASYGNPKRKLEDLD